MPGDPFKKALPGQRLVIPADAFNGFVDAANYVRARRHNTESDAADEFRQTGIVRVRNNTGFALPDLLVNSRILSRSRSTDLRDDAE
jgi:hypothetical protein